jgi:hypothetical protein
VREIRSALPGPVRDIDIDYVLVTAGPRVPTSEAIIGKDALTT